MTSQQRERKWPPTAAWPTTVCLLVLLASCHTVDAITSAPPEFWLHVEAIGIAIWNDIVSLVELIL